MIKDDGVFHGILLVGLFFRLLLLVFTCTDILPIPDAHADADGFHETAVAHPSISSDDEVHLSNYTRFLTLLYIVTDDSRWFAQFLNVVLGVLTLVYIRKILCVLKIDQSIVKFVLIIAAVMPFLNIYSVVLMREAWVSFFVVLSLYHFICWYYGIGHSGRRIALTLLSMVVAMWMHAGVIGLLVGYFLAFISYYRKYDRVRISKSSYVALFFMLILTIVLVFNLSIFLSKLNVADLGEYVEMKSAGEGGGSDYLTWLDLSSPSKLLMFLPLKMFYFLYSPIIVDWRGLNDVVAFALDSVIYLFLSWAILKNTIISHKSRLLKRYLLISIISTIVIFAFGTSNSGTAIRHRAKICPVLLIIYSISSNKMKKEEVENESVAFVEQ